MPCAPVPFQHREGDRWLCGVCLRERGRTREFRDRPAVFVAGQRECLLVKPAKDLARSAGVVFAARMEMLAGPAPVRGGRIRRGASGRWAACPCFRVSPVDCVSTAASADLVGALSVGQVLDSIAIRVDGPKAWHEHLVLSWVVTDIGATYVTELRNGALSHRTRATPAPGSTVFTLARPTLIALVTGTMDLTAAVADGTVIAPVDPNFAIVTP